jgi:hypothetical protein
MQILKSNNRSLSITSKGSPIRGSFSPSSFKKPASSGGGDSSFTPIATDLGFFLDAQTGIYTDAGSTEATDGQAIQQINDQSTSAITATNTEVGFQATYAVASVNGLNSLRLENNNVKDTYSLSSEVALTNNLFTLHVVYKKDATSDSAVFMVDYQNTFQDQGGYFVLLASAAYNPYNEGDEWTVATFKRDNANGFYSFYVNGIVLKNFSSTTSTAQAIDRLFQRPSARTGEYNVGDMLIYTQAQSNTDIATIQNGLNTKYGNLFLPLEEAPAPPTIGSTTLDLYINPDFNTYSDLGKTLATNTDYVRAAKSTAKGMQSITQGTAANQFQLQNTVLPNSKSSLNKSVTSARYTMIDALSYGASESYVVYGVIKRDNSSGTAAIIGSELLYTSTIHWQNNTVYWRDAGNASFSATIPMTNDIVVNAFVVDRASGEMRVYENGTLSGTVDISSSTNGVVHNILYNRRINGNTEMDYGITLVYEGLHSAANILTVSNWMNTYYGGLIY